MNDYVTSQFYLRGFCDPVVSEAGGPFVWAADFCEGKVELRAPTNVGAKSPDSGPEASGSRGDATEDALLKVEAATAPVVRKLLWGDLELTGQERAELLFFAALLVTRIPTFRDTVEETVGDISRVIMKMDGSREDLGERTGEMIRSDLTSEEVDEVRRMAFDARIKVREGSQVVSLTTRMEQASKIIYPIFMRMHWAILRSSPDHGRFITSDRPVSWVDSTAPPMFDLGLCARNLEVLFAVAPTVGLLGRWHGSFGPVPMGSSLIDRANRRQVMFADRYAFADNQETAMRALEMRRRIGGAAPAEAPVASAVRTLSRIGADTPQVKFPGG